MTIDTRLERIQQICDAVATDHFGPDGGRVEVVGIDGPAAMVRLHGACASCMGPNRVLFWKSKRTWHWNATGWNTSKPVDDRVEALKDPFIPPLAETRLNA